ncbi:DNA starvation/stationary phase protection protein Dps [Sphingorhabdus sp. EL138]|uniref:DNA starvation/stationary phase protection protein Dps n=1 Tax=Sphingorhabdus sp. EL138 TaxID=2073156 RepID=UPI000D68FB1D|nr:DNA starvation/stationary phase protection protein Dps [Sphingorhabdus sp. EL138]
MYKTNNTLSHNIRTASIELLQERLFDGCDLMTQTKQAHWNVKGPNFIALHELFDRIHSQVDGYVDLIAERIVALGGQANGTVRSAAEFSSLPEYPLGSQEQVDHVESLSNALAVFGDKIRHAIDVAADMDDQNSSDIFTEISRGIDKSLWFVEAHNQQN